VVTRRRVLLVVLGIAAIFGVVLFGKWRDASNRGGQLPAEPFRIAGNFYYVGANDVTAFLLTGPEGHVLIDGGYPGTAPMIMASIAKLGFKITDVKVLLNSHAHFDHAGGLAELQKASGAQLWVSEGDADIVAAGGAGDPTLGPFRVLSYLPFLRYPAPTVDHRFKDGATIRVGSTELTAHVTPGHTPGCTSWSFPVRDGDRELHVVHICSLTLPLALSIGEYPEIRAEFERSFRTLRSLPVDIWVTSHAREFGRYRKFRERETAKDPADPFIDRDGYVSYIDSAEMRFRKLVAERPPRL
jgi:metallo-beta-lactamase class B